MVEKKHILFIVENESVPYDKRVWSEALAARDFGYIVTIICPEDGKCPKDFRSEDGITILRHRRPIEGAGKYGLILEYLNAFFWEMLLATLTYVKRPFHILHAANPPDHLFMVALPFKLLGVKFIFDHHDIAPENYVAKFGSKGIFHKILIAMEKLTFKTADVVISTNQSYKRIAQFRGRKSGEDVIIVRNGPDLSRIPVVNIDETLREGFKYLVGYVGVIGQQEGIENLLNSVKYIIGSRRRDDIRFIVIGSGPHWEDVVRLSKDMGLDKHIWFTGFVPERKLWEILASVDVCINPEFGNEFTDKSTMTKIMDYMTAGKPIVQYYTAEGSFTAGEASVYVMENNEQLFADKLLELLGDEQKRVSMGRAGRERIEQVLSWPMQKENLRSAYEKALQLS